MKTILLIIIIIGVFYIIDKQSDKDNGVFENYTIEQLKKCNAVSKQTDRDILGSINHYSLNCKNNESIVVDKKIYDLQYIKDVTPEDSKKQIFFRFTFSFSIVIITLCLVFYGYRTIRGY